MYKVQELTEEEQAKHPKATCKLIEGTIVLGYYNEKLQAQIAKDKWDARGDLSEDISVFYAAMMIKYASTLESSEIIKMMGEID